MSEDARMQIGTLKYNFSSLIWLFIWLLLGSFGFCMLGFAVSMLLPLTLKDMQSTNLTIGILIGSIPAALNMLLNPIISFNSDRTRTRYGRRRPYLLFATPFLAVFLILIGWTPKLLRWCGVPDTYFALIAVILIGILIILFQIFYLFVGSTIYYLFVDVVPTHFIGRYMAFFNLENSLSIFIFQRWFLTMYSDYAPWLYTGIAVFYFFTMFLLIWNVKEGEYPPIPPREKKTYLQRFVSGVRTYFLECFSIPFYIWLFIAIAINQASTICRNLFGVFYAQQNVGLSLDQIGVAGSYGALVSVILALPLGFLNDKIHPMKIFTFGAVVIIILNALSFFLIHDYISYLIWTLAMMVAYAVQTSAALPLSARLFPGSRYGQFGSAQAIFCSIVLIVANAGGGMFMDLIKDYSYLFVWDFVLTTLALISILIVFRLWPKYGGERNYVAPLRSESES